MTSERDLAARRATESDARSTQLENRLAHRTQLAMALVRSVEPVKSSCRLVLVAMCRGLAESKALGRVAAARRRAEAAEDQNIEMERSIMRMVSQTRNLVQKNTCD